MNCCFSVRGNGHLDRDSRYLMAESKIISVLDQQAVVDQLVHNGGIVDQRPEQPGLHPGTDQGTSVECISCGRTQRPGTAENSITNGHRQGLAASLQYLSDEERIAFGQPVEFGR